MTEGQNSAEHDLPNQKSTDASTDAVAHEFPHKLRVHALARILGLRSREVLGHLSDMGLSVRSPQSSIDRSAAVRVKELLASQNAASQNETGQNETYQNTGETVPSAAIATPPAALPVAEPSLFSAVETSQPEINRAALANDPTQVPLFLPPQAVTIAAAPVTETVATVDNSAVATGPTDSESTDSDDDGGRRRRRGRRGRGRGRDNEGRDNDAQDVTDTVTALHSETATAESDTATGETETGTTETESSDNQPATSRRRVRRRVTAETDGTDNDSETSEEENDDNADDDTDELGSTRRRRRRRRRKSGTDADDFTTDDDPPNTVVHEREPRSKSRMRDRDEVQGITGSTRLEAKRQRRRDGRDVGRRRPPILTESEFLARRESVNRVMVVRERRNVPVSFESEDAQIATATRDYTQVAVLEDGVLVEHFVTTSNAQSMVGNIYLGRVQNVLPGMEAAFVDIGRGRNGVLYAGEVNWDAAGLDGGSRKIEQALKPGDIVLVQVSKDPVGHKGARLTTQISLAGRYLVYVPGGSSTGISRKLPDVERKRLKQILQTLIPEDAGVIIRTASEGVSGDELSNDVLRLQKQWEEISLVAQDKSNAPTALYEEPDLLVKVVRDLFNEDFNKLVIEGIAAWDLVSGYVNSVAPDLMNRVERFEKLHADAPDVFAANRIEEQLAKALDRKVWLPSGGTLIIEHTEAMTVVDVNTGKFTGAGGNLEETVTRNNIEAAEEIVRQMRLRDIGGMIIVDFIDMVLESNRDLVLRRLTESLGRDRTRHQVSEVTSLGLVQMTRKRLGTGLLEAFSTTCECCAGRGILVHANPVEIDGDAKTSDHKNGDHKSSDHKNSDNKNSDHKNSDHKNGDTKNSDNKVADKKGRRIRRKPNEIGEAKAHHNAEHPMFRAMTVGDGPINTAADGALSAVVEGDISDGPNETTSNSEAAAETSTSTSASVPRRRRAVRRPASATSENPTVITVAATPPPVTAAPATTSVTAQQSTPVEVRRRPRRQVSGGRQASGRPAGPPVE